jgi:hypothetical protein
MGRQGIVSYVVAAAKADFKLGVQLLNMVVPKTAHIDITRHEQTFLSLADLDDELQRQFGNFQARLQGQRRVDRG